MIRKIFHCCQVEEKFNLYLEYLFKGVPSGPIRNFSKFQAISDLLTGFQMKNWGLTIRLSASSEGAGSDFFRYLNNGCSFSPLASTWNCLKLFLIYLSNFFILPYQTSLLWIQTHFQVWHVSKHSIFPCHWSFLDVQTDL